MPPATSAVASRQRSGGDVRGRSASKNDPRPPAEHARRGGRPGPGRSGCCSGRPGRCRARAGRRSSTSSRSISCWSGEDVAGRLDLRDSARRSRTASGRHGSSQPTSPPGRGSAPSASTPPGPRSPAVRTSRSKVISPRTASTSAGSWSCRCWSGDLDVRPRLVDPALEGDDVVVGRDDDEQHDRDDESDGEAPRRATGRVHRDPRLPRSTAQRPSPSRSRAPPRARPRTNCPAAGRRPGGGAPSETSSGTSSERGEDEGVRARSRRPRRRARRAPDRAAAAGSRAGSSSGGRTGWPIPKPSIAALPQASAGRRREEAGRARLGEVGGDLRIVRLEPASRRAGSPPPGRRGRANGRTRPMTVTTSPGSIRASR